MVEVSCVAPGGGCRVAIGGWVSDEETAQWAPEEWVSTFRMEVSRQDFRHGMWIPFLKGKVLGYWDTVNQSPAGVRLKGKPGPDQGRKACHVCQEVWVQICGNWAGAETL